MISLSYCNVLFLLKGIVMPKMSMKELNKFMNNNPDTPATQVIKEQLKKPPAPEPSTGGCTELTARPAQISKHCFGFGGRKDQYTPP